MRNVGPAPWTQNSTYYSDIGLDLRWTGDLVIKMEPPVFVEDPETADLPKETETSDHPRAFARYHLGANVVRATIHHDAETSAVGRVLDASVNGMWIVTHNPLPFRTPLKVELRVPGDFTMSFAGRVVRQTETGMAIHFDTDDTTWRFRSSFIDLARTASLSPPTVVIRKTKRDHHPARDQDLTQLRRKWRDVESDLENEALHQSFIHECLRNQALEYALERYRALQMAHPKFEASHRYLQQIGTILAFSALSRAPEIPQAKPMRWLPVLLMMAALLAALFYAERLVTTGGAVPTLPVATQR